MDSWTTATKDRTLPVQLTDLTGAVAVATGDFHSLALTQDGSVWAWGSNSYGQLGTAQGPNDLRPAAVVGLSDVVWTGTNLPSVTPVKRTTTSGGWWTLARIRHRPACVAFGTLTDSADCLIRVRTEPGVKVADGAARVIVVPFAVPAEGVLVGNLNNPEAVPIPAGRYELVFAAFPTGVLDEEEVYQFTFVPCGQPSARIFRKDAELNPPNPLALDGEAATWL